MIGNFSFAEVILNILVVVAHPDDEILGCGGTIAKFVEEGHNVFVQILGEGATSRDEKRDVQKRSEDLKNLVLQAEKANKIVGSGRVFFEYFPDNRFDTVAFLDIVKAVERIKNVVSPDLVFTHFENDLNVDHRLTFKAVLTAFRPVFGEKPVDIYSFEVLSSTEWGLKSFFPDYFVNVSKTIGKKIDAMKCYDSELREFPHPRSLKGIEVLANFRGMSAGFEFSEAFKCVRKISS